MALHGRRPRQDQDTKHGASLPQQRKIVPPSVAPRRRQTVAFEADRSLTEVSDGEAVEENFEKLGVWLSINIHLFIPLCLRCAYSVLHLLKK